MIVFYLSLVFLFCLTWRLVFILPFPHTGNDGYYFRLGRKAFLKNKTIKFDLSKHYALEYSIQRYPPLFPLFLSIFSDEFLEKFSWVISPIIDSLLCTTIAASAYILTQNYNSVIVASLFYVFAFSAHNETSFLTSRQFAAMLFFMSSLFAVLYITNDNYLFLILSSVVGSLILLSHRFTTQGFFLAFVIMSFFNYWFLIIILLSIVFALLISGGFYWKVFLCNLDFVKYWNKNYSGLGAHQIKDSPAYNLRDNGSNFLFQKNLKSHLLFEISYILQNIYILLIILIVIISFKSPKIYTYSGLLTLSVYFIGILSYHLPFLRGIGFGSQYGKLSLSIGLFTVGIYYNENNLIINLLSYILLGLSIIYAIRIFYKFIKNIEKTKKENILKWDYARMKEMLNFIQNENIDLILTVPTNYHDLITYHTGKKVFWGNHSSPTEVWGGVLPYFKKKVTKLVEKWNISHILIDKRFTNEDELQINYECVFEDEIYKIFKTGKRGMSNAEKDLRCI